jgi:excisionase family DNA binding protein
MSAGNVAKIPHLVSICLSSQASQAAKLDRAPSSLHGAARRAARSSTVNTLSLDQAAKRIGVSRWTVSRALQSGRLLGIRDNRGRWRIEPEPLDAWAAEQRTEQHGAKVQSFGLKLGGPHVDVEEIRTERDQARLETAGLKVEAVHLRERLDEACKRLDELQGEHDQVKLEAASLKVEVVQLRELVAEVRVDRDRWHTLATTPHPSLLERIRLLLRPVRLMPN